MFYILSSIEIICYSSWLIFCWLLTCWVKEHVCCLQREEWIGHTENTATTSWQHRNVESCSLLSGCCRWSRALLYVWRKWRERRVYWSGRQFIRSSSEAVGVGFQIQQPVCRSWLLRTWWHIGRTFWVVRGTFHDFWRGNSRSDLVMVMVTLYRRCQSSSLHV